MCLGFTGSFNNVLLVRFRHFQISRKIMQMMEYKLSFSIKKHRSAIFVQSSCVHRTYNVVYMQWICSCIAFIALHIISYSLIGIVCIRNIQLSVLSLGKCEYCSLENTPIAFHFGDRKKCYFQFLGDE